MKEAVAANDKAQIEDKLKVLTDASAKMAERIYAKKGAEGAAADAASAGAHEAGAGQESADKPAGDSVVDAEFEEVKEDDKK